TPSRRRRSRTRRYRAQPYSQCPCRITAQIGAVIRKKIERSRMKAPIQSSTIGTKGLTFKTSCDSSVAIAPPRRRAWRSRVRRRPSKPVSFAHYFEIAEWLARSKRERVDVESFDLGLERLAGNAELCRRPRGARDPSAGLRERGNDQGSLAFSERGNLAPGADRRVARLSL